MVKTSERERKRNRKKYSTGRENADDDWHPLRSLNFPLIKDHYRVHDALRPTLHIGANVPLASSYHLIVKSRVYGTMKIERKKR